MTGPLGMLERSLREGPPDERGYRPQAAEPRLGIAEQSASGIPSLERLVPAARRRRRRSTWSWQALAAAVIVAVALAAIAIVGASRRPAVPAPSPLVSSVHVPPLTETYTSSWNGFSIRYPAGWTVTPATTPWPRDVFLPGGHPALDTFAGPGVARLFVASQPLGPGQTESAWLAAYFHPYQGAEPCGSNDYTTWPRLGVGSDSGYLDAADCAVPPDEWIASRDVRFHAFAFSGGRVYQFGMHGDIDLEDFKALLAAVRLEPSSARDTPNAS